jgi:hypothetical protein
MLSQQRVWSAQRISVVGMVIVAVIAAAVAVTIILYQLAIADAGQARAADLNSGRAQQLAAVTAEQRISMIEYLTTGSATIQQLAATAGSIALREGAGELVHEHLRPAQTRCGGVRRAHR